MNSFETGVSGLIASVVATPMLIDSPSEGLLNAIVQVIIAVVTLLGIFKKRKK